MNASRRDVFSKTPTTSRASSTALNCTASGPLPSAHLSITSLSPSPKNVANSRNLGQTATQSWTVTSTDSCRRCESGSSRRHRWNSSVDDVIIDVSSRCRQTQSSTLNSTTDSRLAIISLRAQLNRLPINTHTHTDTQLMRQPITYPPSGPHSPCCKLATVLRCCCISRE